MSAITPLPTALTAMLAGLAAAQLDHPERQPVSCPRGPRLQLRQCGGRWRDVDPRCAGCPLGRERSWQLAEATGEITPKGPPSGTTTIAELLGRREGADDNDCDEAGEQEQEEAMQESDQATTSNESTPETQPLAACPCGCGREVASGRTYASKGCAGRMRWRGVGHPKEAAADPAPVASEEIPHLPPWADYGAPIPAIVDLCPRCHEARARPGDGSTRHPRWSCVSCGYTHAIPMGPQGVEWMPVTVQKQLAKVGEETARRCEQEAAALTTRLEAAEAENARLLASLHEEQRQGKDAADDHATLVSLRQRLWEATGLTPWLCDEDLIGAVRTLAKLRHKEQDTPAHSPALHPLGWALDQVAKALGFSTGPGLTPSLDEIERRISALRLAEADRRALAAALEMSETMSLDGLTGKIGYLMRASGTLGVLRVKGIIDDDSNPLASASLPRPEALPTGYAFDVAEYVFNLACILTGKLDEPEAEEDQP